MHYRTRFRIPAIPAIVAVLCINTALAVLTVPRLQYFLRAQAPFLPALTIGVAGLVVLAILGWYLSCYCEIRRGELRLRWMWRTQSVNLRDLEFVEVRAIGRRKLVLHLGDTSGSDLFLPLGAWRDEDLVMARVLRATVDCKQRIDGEPDTVRDFSGLLETYKSWDRRLTAA